MEPVPYFLMYFGDSYAIYFSYFSREGEFPICEFLCRKMNIVLKNNIVVPSLIQPFIAENQGQYRSFYGFSIRWFPIQGCAGLTCLGLSSTSSVRDKKGEKKLSTLYSV